MTRILSTTFFLPLLCAVLLLSACQSLAPAVDPQAQLPQQPERWASDPQVSSQAPTDWLNDFDDSKLTNLVTEALQHNFSLQAVAAQMSAVQAQADIVGAALLPDLDLDFFASRRKTGSGDNQRISNNFDLAGTISWEVDLWQRLAHTERAALAEAAASANDYYAARLSLAAVIARQWFLVNEAALQQQLAERTEESFRKSLQVVEQQYRSGLSSALDLRLARSNLAAAQSNKSLTDRQHSERQRELETLLGRYPAGRLKTPASLPELTRPVPAGMPSQLLDRRPDLAAAAQRQAAAQERSNAAQKNHLPSFFLTASGGTASETLSRLLDWDYLVWSLAGSLAQPLFDGGRRGAEQDLALARLDEQTAIYAETALTAYREVETTLAAEAYFQQQETALQWATEESAAAQLLAEDRYRQGLNDIITLLETQRRAFVAESSLLTTKRQRLENRINLYLALGGPFAPPAAEEHP